MKQRFSSLDVKVIAHELSNSLVTLRVANVYDLSSKIFLLKFAKPDDKKQMIIDSGFRCHLTNFSRATAAAPSPFVARLRKFLKTRRVTAVSQVGTDRIIEFQFSDGQYRMFLEFYAGGNIILTDKELAIIALLRTVSEGEGQEELRVGLKYSVENRQNFEGIPPLTRERLQNALQKAIDKSEVGFVAGKKAKKAGADALRKALAVSVTEYPPLLVDHSMRVTGFDPTLKPAEVLSSETLMEQLMLALDEAKRVVQEITSSETAKGYIIAKQGKGGPETLADADVATQKNLIYDDFHPFRPRQFEDDPTCSILTFDGFNKTVDEFFSSIEGQRLESRLNEREMNAKKKLDAARQDQAKRLGGLQEIQELNIRKAGAIEANIERVQEAMDAVNSLIASGKDWLEIAKLIEYEQKRHNPVADIIQLPLQLEKNTITLLLGEEEALDGDDNNLAYATDSDVSDSDDEVVKEESNMKEAESRLKIDINLGISPWSNAREYYDQKRSAAIKEDKTAQALTKALKNQEQKIAQELKKGLKQEKAVLRPVRQQMWFEKFTWFVSSDGYLVLGGRDAQQNEILYKKYLRKGDVYVHADLQGAASIVIRNVLTPDTIIPPSTLSQAGTLAVASSNAWDSKAGMSAWWVNADQVSKSAPTGEFLPTGSFMVRGKKNFLPPAQLLLGFGVMFRISEESKAKHVKHRLQNESSSVGSSKADRSMAEEDERNGSAHGDDDSGVESHDGDEHDDVSSDENENACSTKGRANPLESGNYDKHLDDEESSVHLAEAEDPKASGIEDAAIDGTHNLKIEDAPINEPEAEEPGVDGDMPDSDGEDDNASIITTTTTATQSKKKSASPLPRGKRAKAKKIAAKYKDQDEEDRLAAQQLIGAALGREKAEAEAKAKAQREAEAAFHKERRRAQHLRNQKETAEHEEARKIILEEGLEALDENEIEKMTSLDAFIGTPLPGDEIIEAIPVCAPWPAMGKYKYKAKLQPGTQKKGKAVKEILDRWVIASVGKGVIDPESRDSEKMWPREVELVRGWKAEECINCVPVGKVRVMMAGGSAGGAGKGQHGKGRGGKGSKKQR